MKIDLGKSYILVTYKDEISDIQLAGFRLFNVEEWENFIFDFKNAPEEFWNKALVYVENHAMAEFTDFYDLYYRIEETVVDSTEAGVLANLFYDKETKLVSFGSFFVLNKFYEKLIGGDWQ